MNQQCAGDVFGDFIKNYTVEVQQKVFTSTIQLLQKPLNLQSCSRLCVQKSILDSCKCLSPMYPSISNADYCGLEQSKSNSRWNSYFRLMFQRCFRTVHGLYNLVH